MSSNAGKARYVYLSLMLVAAGFLAIDAAATLARQDAASYTNSFQKFSFPARPNVSTASYSPYPTGSGDTGSSTSSAPVSNTTSNWSGYVSNGGTYTAITGSWKVPSVSADTNAVSADATWIGIGGNVSDDLIQVGTMNQVENGQVSPGTFYEQLPDTSQDVPGVTVQAGDTITASIKEVSNGEWNITIRDVTNGESYSNNVAYDSSESSAEWIQEAPSDTNSIIPLDNFGSVSFSDGTTTENGSTVSIAGSNAQAYTMDNAAGQALTATSAVDSTGKGFTVSRTSASSDDSFGSYGDIPSGWSRHEPGLGRYHGWGGMGSGYGDPYSTYDPYGY